MHAEALQNHLLAARPRQRRIIARSSDHRSSPPDTPRPIPARPLHSAQHEVRGGGSMTATANPPMFGPYLESFDGDDPKMEMKFLLVPPADIEAMQKLIADAAKLAHDQDAR